MSKVYIISASAHDFSPAEEFGELVPLSQGPCNRYSVNNIHRIFWPVLKDSNPDDYLLVCGLGIMTAVATAIMSHLHGRVHFLLFKKGGYIPRTLILDQE